MTIKELKEKIENLPDNMEVFLAQRKKQTSDLDSQILYM